MALRDPYEKLLLPVSTLIIVSGFMRPEFLVEVEVTAAKPADRQNRSIDVLTFSRDCFRASSVDRFMLYRARKVTGAPILIWARILRLTIFFGGLPSTSSNEMLGSQTWLK